jgi:hypothetical protein
MKPLPPWAKGPFELLVHAEGHYITGEDFDRRIALISFDNAIEVAITTFLTLNPIQRNGRSYERAKVEKWLNNYHSKLDFLEAELTEQGSSWVVNRSYIVYCHDQRNLQYHGGQKGVPEIAVLELIREAALWIFSILYADTDAEQRLAYEIEERSTSPPQNDEKYDEAIDREYDVVNIGEQTYLASEVLLNVDDAAYRELGARLCEAQQYVEDEERSA